MPQQNVATSTSAPTNSKSLISILITAFLAGLVALLTPCVYPMIPITVSIFLKQSKSRKEGIGKALIYGLSIIVFFSVLGFLISLIWGFTALNALSTHWLFNIIIFAVFILFALSFFGLFEMTLPSGIVNKIDRQADRGGLIGIFFMAITLVLVSFSCTFPIVGTGIDQHSKWRKHPGRNYSNVWVLFSFCNSFHWVRHFPLRGLIPCLNRAAG